MNVIGSLYDCSLRSQRGLQRWSEIIGTTTKNGVVPVATSNVKLFLETIW